MTLPQLRPRVATLKDVAERAGVSTATVARVLHDNGYVAEETRETVEAAIRETGYSINAVAQGLRKRRTFTLGHVLHSIAPNPFFAEVARGAEQEASASGCGVVMTTTYGDKVRERQGVETLIRRRVDAIIFTTLTSGDNVEIAVRAGIPVVQVERISHVPAHAVTADNAAGSYAAVEHLIGLGHRRIAFIGVDPHQPSKRDASSDGIELHRRRTIERERLSGYLAAHADADVVVRDELVELGDTYYELERARAAVKRFLALPEGGRPTAVFATCDMLAAGTLQEIYAHRLSVPGDISVVGFDDTYAQHLTPPLTTVRQPMVEIGQAAARLAIQALERSDEVGDPHQVRLTTSLVLRDSTGPPPASA